MKKVQIFILTVVAIIVLIVVLAVASSKEEAKKQNPTRLSALDKVAQCLSDQEAKFYGASWCPHCANQKALFMKSVKKVPYIECSTGGAGSPQTQVCIDAEIQSYPTWVFADGERLTAEVAPIDLASKVSCSLTEEETAELNLQKTEYLEEVSSR